MQDSGVSSLFSLLPLLLMSVVIAISAHMLAREKGRNVLKWTILGSVPILNFICIWFFVGAANLRLERKVDELLSRTTPANSAQP